MKNFTLLVLILCVTTLHGLGMGSVTNTPTHEKKEWVVDIYAVLSGYPVSYSSKYDATKYEIARLDNQGSCWCPRVNKGGEWIEVSSIEPIKWIGVETQGCGHYNGWVKSYKVTYSNEGRTWSEVDEGKTFEGNEDQNSRVKHWFDTPVWARTIRLTPLSWHRWATLRFDFIAAGKAPNN
jgi:hypothetical protein